MRASFHRFNGRPNSVVQAKLIQMVRSLRPGSAERLIVLRATEQGMANLLRASARMPAPRPTVMPSQPASTPGDMHIIRRAEGGPAPAALPAASATQAYVEAGAAPPRPAGGPTMSHETLLSDRPAPGDPAHTLDFRPQPSLGHAQLPTVFALPEARTDLVAAGRTHGSGEDQASEAAAFSTQAAAVVVILLVALVLVWAIAG